MIKATIETNLGKTTMSFRGNDANEKSIKWAKKMHDAFMLYASIFPNLFFKVTFEHL